MKNLNVSDPEFTLKDEDFRFIGEGLNRPECVLDLGGGKLACADWDGGVAIVDWTPSASDVHKIQANRRVHGEKLKPNGLAVDVDGSFLVTHLTTEHGGLYRLHADGELEDVLVQIDGSELPPTNFVLRDHLGRIWITVSTWVIPRTRTRTPDHADGFIILLDDRGARIVADQIGFTNEVRIDSTGTFLYVNETFGRRLTRFSIRSDGSLSERTAICDFGPGIFPDGVTIDHEGCFWITSVYTNRIVRVFPDGSWHLVYEDCDPSFVDELERQYQSGELASSNLGGAAGKVLGNITSLVFYGSHSDEAILGCLDDTKLAVFQTPFARASTTGSG